MASPTLTVSGSSSSTDASPPLCTTAVPDHYGHVPVDACNAYYGWYPTWEGNLTFAVAFGVTTAIHLGQAVAHKKPFCWVIIMGSLWECVCFILRTLGSRDQQNFDYVVSSTLLFLLAPLWVNAFAYMTVARLVYFLLPSHKGCGISARWMAKGFVAADILSFAIQAVGGSMIADQQDREKASTGQKVYMVGIGVQLVFVLAFAAITCVFYRDLEEAIRKGELRRNNNWNRPVIWTVFAVLLLIVIRIVFRFVEFGGGVSSSNSILSNESYQLCLDALPMLIALLLLNTFHPALVLRGPESSIPGRSIWNIPKGNRKKNPGTSSATAFLELRSRDGSI